MENIMIRPFEDEDAEAVEKIENESFSDPWAKGSFNELLKIPLYTELVRCATARSADL